MTDRMEKAPPISTESTKGAHSYVLLSTALFTLLLIVTVSAGLFSSRDANTQPSPTRLLNYNDPKVLCFLGQEPFTQDIRVQLSQRQLLVNTRYPDVKIIVDSSDQTVSKQIANYGSWQPVNLKTFQRFVKKGYTIMNIGAHIGLQAIVLAKQAGDTGKLIIFEPYSFSRRVLKKNICLNELEERTTVYKNAASNARTKGRMYINRQNTGMAFMLTQDSEYFVPDTLESDEVEIDLVDNVLPHDVMVDFALIDVQMSEIECLEGMKAIIARSPNIILIVEWSGYSKNMEDDVYNSRRDSLLRWFGEKNFMFYRIDREQLGGEAIPRSCEKEVFLELSHQQLRDLGPEMRKKVVNIDILIAPRHIDPNSYQ